GTKAMSEEKKRGTIRRPALVLALSLLLGACGSEAAPTNTPVAPTTAPAAVATATSPPAAAATATGAPAAGSGQVINMLWTDSDNLRQPLIKDFEQATGIKVNQVQVQYNALLDKINTTVQGGGDVDVIEMDTIWTAQFA